MADSRPRSRMTTSPPQNSSGELFFPDFRNLMTSLESHLEKGADRELDAVVACCQHLAALLKAHENSLRFFFTEAAAARTLTDIITAMKTSLDHVALQAAGCDVLSIFAARFSGLAATQAFTEDATAAVLAAMTAHPGNVDIQMLGCTMFSWLQCSWLQPLSTTILHSSCLEAVFTAMQTHSESETVIANGCWALTVFFSRLA